MDNSVVQNNLGYLLKYAPSLTLSTAAQVADNWLACSAVGTAIVKDTGGAHKVRLQGVVRDGFGSPVQDPIEIIIPTTATAGSKPTTAAIIGGDGTLVANIEHSSAGGAITGRTLVIVPSATGTFTADVTFSGTEAAGAVFIFRHRHIPVSGSVAVN